MCRSRLFGGTLMCAGLVGGSAAAQEFAFSSTRAEVGAYANYDGSTGPTFDVFYGSGGWSISVDDDGLGIATAASGGSSTAMLNTAYSDARSGAFAQTNYVYFSVTADTLAVAAWDFDLGSGFIRLDSLTDGTTLLSEASGAGSARVQLEAGKAYVLHTLAFAEDDFIGTVFTSLVIPAPGAAALFACAGLRATRRRR